MQTILVVDDKANVRTLVREYLPKEGFRVVTAENGRTALYAARHEKPALLYDRSAYLGWEYRCQ